MTVTPAPTSIGDVFLDFSPIFRFFQIIIPVVSVISAVALIVFIIRQRMFKNLWHKLVLYNRLTACSFALSLFGMLVFIQLVRNTIICIVDRTDYTYKACKVLKGIEVVSLFLTMGSTSALFYCLFVLQRKYENFLRTGKSGSAWSSVCLYLGWICGCQIILAVAIITISDEGEFVVSNSYCLLVPRSNRVGVFLLFGSTGFIFPYFLGWLQDIRLFCTRKYKSIYESFWSIRRMLLWLSLSFFLTKAWLVVNLVMGCYDDYTIETNVIGSILVSDMQNLFDTIIIIYLVFEDIKMRFTLRTQFTEPFQTPCMVDERLVLGPTMGATEVQT